MKPINLAIQDYKTPTSYLESATEHLDESANVDSKEEDEDVQSGMMNPCYRLFQS